MKKLIPALMIFLLAACRGEPVPRDYQNMPPAVSHPVDKPAHAPAKEREIGIPEPSSGGEGAAGPYQPLEAPSTAT